MENVPELRPERPASPNNLRAAAADRSADAEIQLAPDVVPIVPIGNIVLFPGAVMPLTLGRERSVAAAQYAALNKRPLGVLLQRAQETEEPGPADLHEIGTVAQVLRYLTTPD